MFSLPEFVVVICGYTLPLIWMLIAFYCVLLATNMSVMSWGEYEILIQKENVRFFFPALKCHCIAFLSFLCENGKQNISVPISLTPAPSKACMLASAQAPLVSCVATIGSVCPFNRGR